MTTETRTLIEMKDIVGIEFGCPKCGAKVLYPLDKRYDRFLDKCPNCYEPWLITSATANPSAPTTVDGVVKLIEALHRMIDSPFIAANVRLSVNPVSKT